MTAPNIPSQAGTAPTNLAALDSWLLGDGQYVFVLKMVVTDLASGTVTLYAATDTYRGAAAAPRLIMPESLRVSVLNTGFGLPSEGASAVDKSDAPAIDWDMFRAGQMAYGGFQLRNNDGQIDSWGDGSTYGWGDAECSLLFGAITDAVGSLETMLTFKVRNEPEWAFDAEGNSVLQFSVKSGAVNPNGRIRTDVFAGTGGNEGGDDLEGRSTGVLLGRYDNIEPAMLADGNLGYMIDPDKCDALDAVYQRGFSVGTAGTDWTDNVATDGSFDLVRIPNFGPVTCDAKGFTGAGRTGATSDWSLSANFTILATDFGGTTATTAGLSEVGGVWLPPGADARFETELHKSILPLGFYWVAQDGTQLYAGELGSPEDGSSAQTYTEKHIASIERVASPPPVWQVRVGWRPLGVTIDGIETGGPVTEAEIARLKVASRYAVATDSSVQDDYPQAIAVTIHSSLFVEANADTLAAELLAILKVRRDVYRARVVRHPLAVWIGQIATLDLSNVGSGLSVYGLDTAKKVLCTGWDIRFAEQDPNASTFVLECWG